MTYLTEPGWAAARPVHRTSQQIRYYVGLLVGRARFLEGVARICDNAGVDWEWTTGRERPFFRPVVITLHGEDGDVGEAEREIALWAAAFGPPGGAWSIAHLRYGARRQDWGRSHGQARIPPSDQWTPAARS